MVARVPSHWLTTSRSSWEILKVRPTSRWLKRQHLENISIATNLPTRKSREEPSHWTGAGRRPLNRINSLYKNAMLIVSTAYSGAVPASCAAGLCQRGTPRQGTGMMVGDGDGFRNWVAVMVMGGWWWWPRRRSVWRAGGRPQCLPALHCGYCAELSGLP